MQVSKCDNFTCPFCGSKDIELRQTDTITDQVIGQPTNAWFCEECPFICLEFYTEKDIDALKTLVK